jgi:hypothetical protein
MIVLLNCYVDKLFDGLIVEYKCNLIHTIKPVNL